MDALGLTRRGVAMTPQGAFNFDDPEIAAAAEEVRAAQEELTRALKKERYNWAVDFPPNLSHKRYLVLQIQRDMLALEECDPEDHEYRQLFIDRIAGCRQEFIKET